MALAMLQALCLERLDLQLFAREPFAREPFAREPLAALCSVRKDRTPSEIGSSPTNSKGALLHLSTFSSAFCSFKVLRRLLRSLPPANPRTADANQMIALHLRSLPLQLLQHRLRLAGLSA